MTKRKLTHSICSIAARGALMALSLTLASGSAARAVGKTELKTALLATVRVVVAIEEEEDLYSTGSGSVLTSDGYVLTNFHVMGDTDTRELYNREGIAAIAVNSPDLKGLPTFAYDAHFVRGDPVLDVAVLKVIAPFGGSGELPDNLGLMPMPLGDSDLMEIGDELSAIGYPGLGGDSVTFTKGSIAGFLDEDGDGAFDWFKTDAEVNHGNSGGAAIDEAGEMIGVPTAGFTDPESVGKISLVRPLRLVEPLIKAATTTITATTGLTSTAGPSITNLVFTDRVDRRGQPGEAKSTFDQEATDIFAVFRYEGFQDGLRFEVAWQRNGEPYAAKSWVWDGGESGTHRVSLTERRTARPGIYELTLTLGGTLLHSARCGVGVELPPAEASFTSLIFAEGATENDQPIGVHEAGQPFAAGTTRVYAFVEHHAMAAGTVWSRDWFVDDQRIAGGEEVWAAGEDGTQWLRILSGNGLPAGHYRLELGIAGQPELQGEFDIGEGEALQIEEQGVRVMGLILDADTQQPVAGASFVVLKPGELAQVYLAGPDAAMVYAQGEADWSGRFSLDGGLERGLAYTFIASAEGYQPAIEENRSIDESTVSPLELTITLQRR